MKRLKDCLRYCGVVPLVGVLVVSVALTLGFAAVANATLGLADWLAGKRIEL